MGSLTNLTHLYLNGNQITTLPDTIGRLINLKHLVLDGNRLTTLSDSIGGVHASTTQMNAHAALCTRSGYHALRRSTLCTQSLTECGLLCSARTLGNKSFAVNVVSFRLMVTVGTRPKGLHRCNDSGVVIKQWNDDWCTHPIGARDVFFNMLHALVFYRARD